MDCLWARQAVVKEDIKVKVVIIIIFVIQMRHILHARQIAVGQPTRHIHRLALEVVRPAITITESRAGSVCMITRIMAVLVIIPPVQVRLLVLPSRHIHPDQPVAVVLNI